MAKRKTSTSANIIVGQPTITWKRRPSEIRGYHRALYMTTENGDYLRVDYNLKDARVRLYIEVAAEGGSAYYSVISNGRITAEKSVQSGRTFAFAGKFRERADIFSTIPNKEVVRLINKNYGIGRKDEKPKRDRERELEETRRRYFKAEDSEGASGETVTVEEPASRYTLVDLVDVFVGAALSALLFFLFQYSFIAMGAVAAFYGIIIGLVDMFVRDRSPLISKVVFFVFIGTFAYIYGYFFS